MKSEACEVFQRKNNTNVLTAMRKMQLIQSFSPRSKHLIPHWYKSNAASFSSYSENRPRILNTAGFVQSSVTTPSFMADFYRQAPLQAKTMHAAMTTDELLLLASKEYSRGNKQCQRQLSEADDFSTTPRPIGCPAGAPNFFRNQKAGADHITAS